VSRVARSRPHPSPAAHRTLNPLLFEREICFHQRVKLPRRLALFGMAFEDPQRAMLYQIAEHLTAIAIIKSNAIPRSSLRQERMKASTKTILRVPHTAIRSATVSSSTLNRPQAGARCIRRFLAPVHLPDSSGAPGRLILVSQIRRT